MKKLIPIFIIVLSVIISCNNPNSVKKKKGTIPIKFSLQPAYDNGYVVSRAEAILTKDNFTKSMNLTIEADSASGTFYDLEPGVYHIKINLYDDNDSLFATGETDAEVVAGQVTTVHITLHFIHNTGDLVIIVDWVVEKNFPDSILFIGNSYTYVNGGIDVHLKRFAESAHSDWTINTSRVAFGGYTLEQHYYNSSTMATINNGNHDYVILQEQSTRPIEQPDSMYYYATLLNNVITSAGANTVFFMTWAHEDNPNSIDKIANAYNYIAKQLHAEVVPVGLAFKKANEIYPDLELFQPDHSHPNEYGTYLTVCTFYAFLYDESPIGVEYIDNADISDDDRDTIQYIAWETYKEYSSN